MRLCMRPDDGVMMPIDDSISLRHGGQFNGLLVDLSTRLSLAKRRVGGG